MRKEVSVKKTILSSLLIIFIACLVGCVNIDPITPEVDTIDNEDESNSYDALELFTQTDCFFMEIKVITLLPGILTAQFEDERGVYFYSDNFKNAFNAFYSNAGIFIPKSKTSDIFAFAEKGSPNSIAVLSCDNLNFTKTKIYHPNKIISPQK